MTATPPDPLRTSRSTPPALRTIDQVRDLIILGQSCPEIADLLNISVHTARHHVQAVLRASGYRSTAKFVAHVWYDRCRALREENAEQARTIAQLTATLALLGRRHTDRTG